MSSYQFNIFIDIIDIAIVAFIFYRLYLSMKGTKAIQMFGGLFMLILVSFIARWFNLNALNWMLGSLKTVWLIAFVILFQPELRKALTKLGQNPILRPFLKVEESTTINEIVKACFQISERGYGALISIERNIGLKNFIETGTPLDAKVTEDLLVTLFTSNTPLHDGAVIIEGSTIIAAGCILPLSQNPRLPQSIGTRHRAAIGLSEETDSINIIVSEENGMVSIAVDGKLKRKLDVNTLRNSLVNMMGIKSEGVNPAPSG
ncbi:MAG: diadenylate cyclase CdaA [Candidatus Krumholzibacteriota bacterium]|nr:diadenylate cyclase CdaA [Candidatus Krumholzibacteriota bacterium]